ncbi:hypothetical protein I5E31_30930 [Pseudomonas aeruginosa]|nr:hypothetical protein [Pseudomonas aeruginosa]
MSGHVHRNPHQVEAAEQVLSYALLFLCVVRLDAGDMALVLNKLSVSVIGDDVPLDAVANASIAERLVDGVLLVDFHSTVPDGIDSFVAAGQGQGQKWHENDRSQVHVILECFENEREGFEAGCILQGDS